MSDFLNQEEVNEAEVWRRVEILACVDEARCGSCGRKVPDGTADDPQWFVDASPEPDGTVLADIRCPRCW